MLMSCASILSKSVLIRFDVDINKITLFKRKNDALDFLIKRMPPINLADECKRFSLMLAHLFSVNFHIIMLFVVYGEISHLRLFQDSNKTKLVNILFL